MRLLAFFALAAGLAGYAFWVYLRAELPVRSGLRLAFLRAAALVLVLALLFDLRLAWGGGSGGARRWALLDVSASMAAAHGAAWDAAVARAAALEAQGWTVIPFGGGLGEPGVPTGTAEGRSSALAPALTRAMEAGVGEVRVLSDLRFQDPVAAASALAAAPMAVDFEAFGGALLNGGVAAFRVRDQGRRGDPVAAEVEYFAEGAADSLQLEFREEGRLIHSVAVAPPTAGRRGRLQLSLPPAQGEGRLRYTVHVVRPGDVFEADDQAAAYMNAGHEAGGLVVVSLSADWEPRALFTVLAEATGLEGTGYLRVGPDRFVPMGTALQRGDPVDSATVGAAVDDAALLVLHGIDAGADAWGRSLARRPGGVLLWPRDAVGADVARVGAGSPQGGEWYAAPDVPSSPVAGELAGIRLQDLPPLGGLLPLDSPAGVVSPLLVQLGGTGPGRPALVLEQGPDGRRAVALVSGFWRWAARDGAAKDAYRRLWSGVAGWLLAQDPAASASKLRPERWISPAGEPVTWWVPGQAGDSVRLEILDADGAPVVDTVVAPGASVATATLPAGTYGFRGERVKGGRQADTDLGQGRFDVEAGTEELLPQPVEPSVMSAVPPLGSVPGRGTPLRTGPWPYLLLLLLVSAEWVGRRRAGLR